MEFSSGSSKIEIRISFKFNKLIEICFLLLFSFTLSNCSKTTLEDKYKDNSEKTILSTSITPTSTTKTVSPELPPIASKPTQPGSIVSFGKGDPRKISFSPDGKILAIASTNAIQFYDSEKYQIIHKIELNADFIDMAYSADGKKLAIATLNDFIYFWEGNEISQGPRTNATNNWVTKIVFSPNNLFLAIGYSDGEIILWDINKQEKIYSLKFNDSMIESLAFSSDSITLVSTSDENIIGWNVATGKNSWIIKEDYGIVLSIGFSPDGKYLLTSSTAACTNVYNTKNQKLVKNLECFDTEYFDAIFSSKGKYIAWINTYGAFFLWDGRNMKRMELIDRPADVRIFAFTPNEKSIIFANSEGNVSVWNIKFN